MTTLTSDTGLPESYMKIDENLFLTNHQNSSSIIVMFEHFTLMVKGEFSHFSHQFSPDGRTGDFHMLRY